MSKEIIIKYVHPGSKIGLQDVRSVWLLSNPPIKLTTSIYWSNLIYRMHIKGKRISYKTLIKRLVKRQAINRKIFHLLPF